MVERPHPNRDLSEIERRLAGLVWIGRLYDVLYDPPRARVLYGEDDFWPPIYKNPFQPVQEVTNWLPWLTDRGLNDRSWTPPEEGEQVLVLSPSGDREQGVILGALYSPAGGGGHVPAPAPASGDDARNWRVWWHRVVPFTQHWIAKAERILRGGNVCHYRKSREGTPWSAPTYERREVIRPETRAILEQLAQATCNGGHATTNVQAAGLGAGAVADLLIEAGVVGPGNSVSATLQSVNGEAYNPQPMPPTDRAKEIGSTRGGPTGPADLTTRVACLGPGNARRTHTNAASAGNATETHTITAGGGHAEHTITVSGTSAHFRLEVTDGGTTSYIDVKPHHIVISSPRIDLNPDR